MSSRSWRLIVCFLLAVISIGLLITHRSRNAMLSQAERLLADDSSRVDEYLARNRRPLEAVQATLAAPFRAEVIEASDKFSEIIDSLRLLTSKGTQGNAVSFFETPGAIPPALAKELHLRFGRYERALSNYLEAEIPKARTHLQELLRGAREQFEKIEAKAAASPNNYRGTMPVKIYFKDREIIMEIGWLKKNDSILWRNQEGYQQYVAAVERNASLVHATRSGQLMRKLSQSFDVPGQLIVYGETYNLDHITTAELLSSYKYLAMLKADIETDFRAAIIELTFL